MSTNWTSNTVGLPVGGLRWPNLQIAVHLGRGQRGVSRGARAPPRRSATRLLNGRNGHAFLPMVASSLIVAQLRRRWS